jgi:DegV family protein with EDD domain
MLKIVTDSSSDLPPESVRRLDITVVPLSVHFGDRTYVDGEDIDVPTFYRMLQTERVHPRTAQPPVGRFEEAFRCLAAAGHDIVAITLAASLSGTFNSARLAARNVPEARVTVVDSGTTSMALGLLVMRTARLAQEGRAAAEVVDAVRTMMSRLTVFFLVDTLVYLQRGGRIGRARSLLGTMLNVKPILTLHDGVVTPLRRVRTRAKALQEVVAMATAQAPIEEAYVMHAAAAEQAAELAAMIQPACDSGHVDVLPLGPVIGAHSGPGTLGVILLRKGEAAILVP